MCAAASPPELWGVPEGFLHVVGAAGAQLDDLEAFRLMLARANAQMNLVGDSTLEDFWRRHFLDSAQLLWFSPGARRWADLGSGAGLPGVIIAILLKGRPGAKVHLVESMGKRCRFLASVVEALNLPAEIHNVRAESLKLTVEVVTARACAPLSKLLSFAEPYLARGARGLFLKGKDVEAEVAEARTLWRFDAELLSSLSDPRGRVLSISEFARVRRA
jgi:16S rRNA (guanine527-N7)-methyltransferase